MGNSPQPKKIVLEPIPEIINARSELQTAVVMFSLNEFGKNSKADLNDAMARAYAVVDRHFRILQSPDHKYPSYNQYELTNYKDLIIPDFDGYVKSKRESAYTYHGGDDRTDHIRIGLLLILVLLLVCYWVCKGIVNNPFHGIVIMGTAILGSYLIYSNRK